MDDTRRRRGNSFGVGRQIWQQLKLMWKESRPVVQLIFIARFLCGLLLAGHRSQNPLTVAAGVVAWLSACMAVYLFNGIMDVNEDRGNSSIRPIASGHLGVDSALKMVAGLATLALAVGSLSGLFLQTAVFLLLGYTYSGPPRPAKRFGVEASVVITGLGAVTFWAGACIGGGPNVGVVIFAVVMSTWMGLVGALVKDLGDVAGDALAGRRTFAVVYGRNNARRLAAALALTVAAAGVIAAAGWDHFLLPAMFGLAAGAVWVAIRCGHLRTGDGRARARRPYRAFMVVQYVTTMLLLSSVLIRVLSAGPDSPLSL